MFAAWTDPAHLPRWWGPDGFTTTVRTLEPRPGGRLHLELRAPDGSVHPCRGTFREVHAPARIVLVGDPVEGHPCGAGLPPHVVMTLSFIAREDGGTRLVMHTRVPSAQARAAAVEAGFERGWNDSFDALAVRLKTPV